MRVVGVRRTDEGRGALKFSLFAEDNKKAKSFVLRASASVCSRRSVNVSVTKRESCISSARISKLWAFFELLPKIGCF